MSKWGLRHKGVEILTPEEWNTVVDALGELDSRVGTLEKYKMHGGLASFTGDGSTKTFYIAHELEAVPDSTIVGKGSPNLPSIDYWTADDTYIIVEFETPPGSDVEIKLWWFAFKHLTQP